MVTYRKALPEERTAYLEFADMVFTQNGDPISFEASIPKVYGAHMDTADWQYVAVDDEKGIRGLIGVMPNDLYVGNETLKIGYVGTVSVHPQARGEGHMKRLMQLWKEEMLEKEVDVAFLGGQRQRYEYFGYAKGGVCYDVTITMPNIRHALKSADAAAFAFVRLEQDSCWLDDAHALFEMSPMRFRRDKGAFVDCCRSYLHEPWVILENGAFVGYLICDHDKKSIVEIRTKTMEGFDCAVKGWMTQHSLKRICLTLPEWEQDLLRHVGSYAEHISYQSSLQASVLKPRRVLKAMLAFKAGYAKLENGSMCLSVDGDCFTVCVQDGVVSVEDGGENPVELDCLAVSKMLASPFDYEGRPEAPAGWFPLPFFAVPPDEF